MQRNDQASGRIPEPVIIDDREMETHFVGDSMTAESIDNLRRYMDQKFDEVGQHIDHIVKHDRAFPTEGCEYCGVPSAA
jgi:hypothetical protein